MKRAVSFLLWMFILVVPAFAQSFIKPFGELQWDDSFTSAAQKIKRLPGIESCQVSYFMREASIDSLDAKVISALPGKMLKQRPKSILMLDVLPGYKLDTFTDANTGQQFQYVSGGELRISAYPVMLCDVAFRLTATFEPNPGIFLCKPQNAIQTQDGHLIPLVMRDVKLKSDSKALALKEAEITRLISAKYFGGKYQGGTTSQKDTYGTTLCVMSGSPYLIDYGASYGSGYSQYLKKAYAQYMSQLALKSSHGKPDLSSGL